MQLSEKSKRNIEAIVGLSFEKIVKMDSILEKAYVEEKNKKKLVWPNVVKVRTITMVDEKIAKINYT